MLKDDQQNGKTNGKDVKWWQPKWRLPADGNEKRKNKKRLRGRWEQKWAQKTMNHNHN